MMAARFSDDDIRLMVERGVDPPLEESLRKMQAQVSDYLQSTDLPTLKQLESAHALEARAVRWAQEMAEVSMEYRDAAASFVGRSGEEAHAVVAALQVMAAWVDARRAEAQQILASARLLPDRYLRTFAAAEAEPEELVYHATNEYLMFLSGVTEGVDAAVSAGGGVGARFAERYVALAEELRRGVASYVGQTGEGAVMEALRRQAALVEAMCANPDELMAKIEASSSWRLWKEYQI